MVEHAAGIRLDKWLWQARFFKSRSLAASAVSSGARVNGARVTKPSALVRPGDELTFKQNRRIRYVKVLACGERRGPAAEAALLYEDKTPPVE
ncbi:MAG: RNA-binding S4 domain-containing protein [Pseudomonadota bacterium]